MNQRLERNYYELLDIEPGASKQEIEEAYKRVKKIYGDDSVAVYSLFSTEEKETLLKQITEAYETLKDPSKKRKYDNQMTAHDAYEETVEVDMDSLRDNIDAFEKPSVYEQVHDREVSNPPVRLKRSIVTMDGVDPMTAEQYRILYANLEQISLKNSYKTFAITSAIKGEGKSITSINLSYMMAREFKKKVLLVECDMRNPTITSHFIDVTQTHSLEDVLNRKIAPEEAIRNLDGTSLFLLSAGSKSTKSAEILGSQRLKTLFERLKTEFDYIILDCPPIIPVVDMQIISKQVDGVVLVVRANKTPKDIVSKALKSLSDTNMVGIVLNGTDTIFNKYYY